MLWVMLIWILGHARYSDIFMIVFCFQFSQKSTFQSSQLSDFFHSGFFLYILSFLPFPFLSLLASPSFPSPQQSPFFILSFLHFTSMHFCALPQRPSPLWGVNSDNLFLFFFNFTKLLSHCSSSLLS